MPKINKSVEITSLKEIQSILEKLNKDSNVKDIHFSGNINKENANRPFICSISWKTEEEI